MDKYIKNEWIGIVLFIIFSILLYVIYLRYDREKRIEEFFENEREEEEEYFKSEEEDEEEHFENEGEEYEDEEEYYAGRRANTTFVLNTPAVRARIATEKAKKKEEDKKKKDEKKAKEKAKKDAGKAKKDEKAKATEEKKTQQVMAQNVEKVGSIMVGDSGQLEKCDIKVDEWSESANDIKKENVKLSKMMECQIRNMIKENVRNNVVDVLSAQRPLMSGPSGPIGPPGPPGSKLQASGKIYNQLGSFESTDTMYERPNMVVSRASGTNPSSSYVYMDKITPFVSYQTWYYNDKNQVVNRYDNNCMTYTKGSDKIYMDQCDDNNMRQKWFWDRTNRFVSLDTSENKGEKIKCLNVTTPMTDSLMSSVPDCTGDQCTNKGLKRFLVVGDCGKNTVTSSQLFSFG